MPNRIIYESILTSRSLARLSLGAERLFYRLLVIADDYGRFDADSAVVSSRCFPLEMTEVIRSEVDGWMVELVGVGLIHLYYGKTDDYVSREDLPIGEFIKWDKYQRIRTKRSRFPAPHNTEDRLNPFYLARFIPIEVRRAIYKRDRYRCLACKKAASDECLLVIDHIIPVKMGGTADPGNLQTLCRPCNAKKSAKTLDYRESAANGSNSPQSAAECGLNPIQSNPNQSISNLNPNLNPTHTRGFDRFWIAYPKKRSKGQAERTWAKLSPTEPLQAQILAALERVKTSEDWQRETGRFIPHPATWLNAKGWEDQEVEGVQPYGLAHD